MTPTLWQRLRDWWTRVTHRLVYCPRYGHAGSYPDGRCIACGADLHVPWSLDDQ